MQCPACRHENPAQAKFCLECGTRLVVSCSNCRAELPPSAKFCLECGERVTPSRAAMVSPSASPEAYTPKHLAERILTAKAELEVERKQVTVLFADLKGSMELLADRDPEEARKILDPVLAHMMDAVHRCPGTVLIAPATFHLVEGFVAVKSLGRVPVKGRSEPVEVHELSGIGPARSRLQAAARRGLTRFVGRDTEIEVLRRSLERAGAGHGQAVAIVGEAGLGKSRLVWEFTRSPRTHGWLVLETGSVSYGTTTPYLPVIELLKTYLSIQEHDDPREIRERVAGKLVPLDPTLEQA